MEYSWAPSTSLSTKYGLPLPWPLSSNSFVLKNQDNSKTHVWSLCNSSRKYHSVLDFLAYRLLFLPYYCRILVLFRLVLLHLWISVLVALVIMVIPEMKPEMKNASVVETDIDFGCRCKLLGLLKCLCDNFCFDY